MVQWKDSKSLLQDVRRFPEFAERFLKIQTTKGGELLPFTLNRVQSWFFWKHVVPTWEAGKPLRIVILKARQEGFSTFCQAFDLWVTLGRRNTANLVIGRDEEQSLMLFRMIHRMDQNLPIGDALPVFVKAKCNKHEIEYNRPPIGKFPRKLMGRDDLVYLDSRVEIKSAQTEMNLGRAGTYHCVHASEVAFWPDLVKSMSALLSACHEEPHTAVFLESTANGFNQFHSFWSNLELGDQEVPTDWQRVFVPWYWDPRYELKLDIKRFFVDQEEEDLYKRITEDQTAREIDPELNEDRTWYKIFWRRKTIRDKSFGDIEKFKQEYPSTDVEAFIFAGTSAFGLTALKKMERHIKNPVMRVNINFQQPKQGEEIKKDKMGRTHPLYQFEEHERGRLLIYEPPQPKARYVIFGDSAEGKAAESFGTADERKSKFDFTAASVLRVDTYPKMIPQVAIWHGTIDPDLFGDLLVVLGWYCNEAYLGWEINGPGRSLNLQIVEKWRYSNIYMREDLDSITHRTTQKPGWRTTPGTKPDLVATGQRYVREQTLVIYDSATLMEMKAFSRVGQNRYEAAEGHDDRVITIVGGLTVVEPRLDAIRRQVEAEKKKDALAVAKVGSEDEERWEPHQRPHPILGDEW